MGSHTPIEDAGLVLFDGICNLCNSSVQFIIRRDPKGKFKFASLQSETGLRMLRKYNLNSDTLHSIIFVQDNKAYERSDAVLRILKELKSPWPALYYIFRLIPGFLRNACYNFVAHNRYRFFGRRDSCMLPTADLQSRFL